jgi:hypothetical protein
LLLVASLGALGSLGCGPETTGGTLYAITSNTAGSVIDSVDIDLYPPSGASDDCEGATRAAGDCCVFAAVGGIATPAPSPNDSTVVGAPATPRISQANAGTVTVVDTTTAAKLTTSLYADGGYLATTFSPAVWSAGDEITFTASGEDMPAFSVSGRTLAPFTSALVATVVQGLDLRVAWDPGPSDQRMVISMSDQDSGATVHCGVPASQGEVLVDATLIGTPAPGTTFRTDVTLEETTTTQTPAGSMVFVAQGSATGTCTVK